MGVVSHSHHVLVWMVVVGIEHAENSLEGLATHLDAPEHFPCASLGQS